MAVARLKRLTIYIHQSFKDKIIDTLQKAGCVEIISHLEDKDMGLLKREYGAQDLDAILGQIDWTISFVSNYCKTKIKRLSISKEEDLGSIRDLNYKDIYNRIKTFEARLAQIDTFINKLEMQKSILMPWQGLNIHLEDFQSTENVEFFLGFIGTSKIKVLNESLLKNSPFCSIEEVSLIGSQRYIIITLLKNQKEKVLGTLKEVEFKKVEFLDLKGKPGDIISNLTSEINKLNSEKDGLIEAIKRYSKELPNFMRLYDFLNNIRNKSLVEALLYKSHSICVIECWANSRDVHKIKRRLFEICNLIHLESHDPQKHEEVPIILENKRVFRPFEFVTKVYGLPSYNEVDPTPLLAPFFFIYFGFCVGDAGYGIVITVLSLWALKKFRLGEYTRLLQLLCLGGISITAFGLITGSFFGNIIEIFSERDGFVFKFLQNLKNSLILIDVNKEPVKLLTLALGFGIIQVWTGNLIAAFWKIKNKKVLDSILDQGSILLFISGFTVFVLGIFNVLPKDSKNLSSLLMTIGGIGILLFAGRENKNLGARLFGGVYVLYNTWAGYISDVLSHSRLWALGLVSGIMAVTCNIFGMMAAQIPFVGILIAFLILIAGHAFIIIINILGALIHSGRLQFVEFFSKFFVGGGRAFRPFAIESKYTTIQ